MPRLVGPSAFFCGVSSRCSLRSILVAGCWVGRALYYGAILAARKTKFEAKRYLERSKDASLLPEEEALRSQAASQVAWR